MILDSGFQILEKTFYPASRDQYLVPRIIYSQINDEMRHGLFPKDDISEKDSTEFRRDLTFEGLRPKTYGRMHSLPKKNVAPKTLKGKITATEAYRYRLEGIVLAS